MLFKGVLLDLDNTLYDYETAHKPALHASTLWLSEQFKLSHDTVLGAYKTARSQINKELKGLAASHSRLLYFQRSAEILGFNPTLTVLQSEELYWNTFLNHMELRPDSLEFLDAIRETPVAIVTDLTAQIQFRKLLHLGIENRFAAVVTSEESGAEKPDARIFELALRKLRIGAVDACVIGDSWQKDILGGTNLGMRSFWLRMGQEKSPDADGLEQIVSEFESFKQLKDLIGSL
jgi:putative hydrolase of the HAD superfamily